MKGIIWVNDMTANEAVMVNLTSLQDALEDLYVSDRDDYCCGDIDYGKMHNAWNREDQEVIDNYNKFIEKLDDEYNHNNFGGDDCLIVIDKIREYMHDGISIKRDVDHIIPVNKEVVRWFDLDFLVEFYSGQQRYKDGIICSQFPGIEKIFFDVNTASSLCTFWRSWKMAKQEKPSLLMGDDYGLNNAVLTIMERVTEDLKREEVYIGGKVFQNLLNLNEDILFRKHHIGDSENNNKFFYTQFGTCIEAVK